MSDPMVAASTSALSAASAPIACAPVLTLRGTCTDDEQTISHSHLGIDTDAPLTPVCESDGQIGMRVQVVYARAADKPDRYAAVLPTLREKAGIVDAMFSHSAAETGGSRRIRFVHGANCGPVDVSNAVLPNDTDDDGWTETHSALNLLGYHRSDRLYMVFLDADPGYCGLGTRPTDTRPGYENDANTGGRLGISTRSCWYGAVAAHELMHNLGAVQTNAPNSNGMGHCTDDWDNMCYSEVGAPPSTVVCNNNGTEPTDAHDYRFDCNHDDYFHTNPPAGSYLDTNWNTANNQFLIGAPRPPGSWAWETKGGVLAGSPDASSWGTGRLDVFVRGTDNQLYRKYFDGGWVPSANNVWHQLGGTLASDPTAVSWSSGRIDVFARDTTGTLIHKWCNSVSQCNGTSWSPAGGWESLGGTIVGAPDVSTLGVGRLDVFARGAANTLMRLTYNYGWGLWADLGGVLTSDPTAVRSHTNEIHVFARDTNNTLAHKFCKGLTQCNGTSWSPSGLLNWEGLGAPTAGVASEPDVSSWGNERLDVFVRGSDNRMHQKFFNGSWSGWASRSSNDPDSFVASGPGAVSWGTGRVDVFARNYWTNTLSHGWFP